jgi:hypothetical protein
LRAGIDVTLEPYEFGVFLDEGQERRTSDVPDRLDRRQRRPRRFSLSAARPRQRRQRQAQNYSFWRDPAFHKLMLAGQQTPDGPKRAAIYRGERHGPRPGARDSADAFGRVVRGEVVDRGHRRGPDNSFNFITMKPRGGP